MTSNSADSPHRTRRRQAALVVLILLLLYGAVAYFVIPYEYARRHHRHPGLAGLPDVTTTGDGHPGDPINVALIGDERAVKRLLVAAGYYPADPLTLHSCLEIADATVLKRPYDTAPVSNLYCFDRKQDLAFEYPVGDNPRERHHVRFWKAPSGPSAGGTIWIGQTSFDRSVGLSHTTGQITHHIAPDVDTERDFLFTRLEATGQLTNRERISEFHAIKDGTNGGGDPWRTDGALTLGTVRQE